ncbi:MAG: hypothetical protein HY820_34485 [Acidobacteria bacterium]|nr:hypothetical protein [Acidobacteriota bacterium]
MLRWILLLPLTLSAQTLPGTAPLTMKEDGAVVVVEGIHRFLDRYEKPASRTTVERLGYILGATEPIAGGPIEVISAAGTDPAIAHGPGYDVLPVRWRVFDDLWGEGLLLEPKTKPTANVIALGDADWSPEMLAGLEPGIPAASQYARRLAENGARVLIPVLMDRKSTYSGEPRYRKTNMPHREFLWRILYPLGRHIIGVEAQKVIAAAEAMSKAASPAKVIGYGEGGLIALHAAALSPAIASTVVSGYFGPRDDVWKEPVYRDTWGLLPDFRDSALAGLIAPRRLIIETAPGPTINGPPAATKDRRGAAPHGKLAPFTTEQVESEIARIPVNKPRVIHASAPGSDETLRALLGQSRLKGPAAVPKRTRPLDNEDRLRRNIEQLLAYSRRIIRNVDQTRPAFWAKSATMKDIEWNQWATATRERVWTEMIGKLPAPSLPPNARTRRIFETEKLVGYEVLLDVFPEVNAYGWLLIPKNIRPGEKRPVVVCQHGLEGRPKNVADPNFRDPTYEQFAVRLAEMGFITFSPQHPYTLGDRFRQINRKAHPFGLTQFSFATAMHQQILAWLSAQPNVDAARIGFYGLSYGGFSAMRIPAVLTQYALSICSGNFNQWTWKIASLDAPFVYPLTGEYDIPEFNFAHIADHAELAALIFPRPFYVERGHRDGVAWDEWVAFEYAKVFRLFHQRGQAGKTAIEYFDGPHKIHGVGTYAFLRRQLGL